MVMIRRVEGVSMQPSLAHGRIIMALRHKRCKVGDVVIAMHTDREVIKRIAHLKDDKVFLTGDNAASSTDSRVWGWLPLSVVRGVVLGVGHSHG